ncbi:hypothetical protein VLF92_21130 [Pseudomonas chengduensis]
MSEDSERRAQRSPNYPMQGLEWAIDVGLKLLEKEGLHPVVPDIIATNLGYKDASNGRAKRVLANLKAFGILQKAAGLKLSVSPDVRKFKLTPSEEDRAIFVGHWLKRPLLYSKLLDKYGDNLPSDKALVFELVDEHNFMENAAKSAIEVFRASLSYAARFSGALQVNREEADEFSEDEMGGDEEDAPPAISSPPQGFLPLVASLPSQHITPSSVTHTQVLPVQPAAKEGVRYPIRLVGGRMAWIEVPDPFYEADKSRLKAQLEIIGTYDEDKAFEGQEM